MITAHEMHTVVPCRCLRRAYEVSIYPVQGLSSTDVQHSLPALSRASTLSTAEEELLIHLHELIVPESVSVEDVGGMQLGGDAAGKVFDTFAYEAPLYRSIIAKSFGEGFLQQW